jgi:hypothetical protein
VVVSGPVVGFVVVVVVSELEVSIASAYSKNNKNNKNNKNIKNNKNQA